MFYAHSLIIFLKLFLVFSSEGPLTVLPTLRCALYGHAVIRCQSTSYDGHDAVYLEQVYINKMLGAQYNSTLGKMVGYTKTAQEIAKIFNKSPSFIAHEIWKTNLCKRNIPLVLENLLKPVEPYIWLRSAEAVNSKHPRMLICSMYDFYPKLIKVTWLRDGKEVKSDVTSTEELPSGNWLYQLHSYLEFTPKPGEKISCMVEHASLTRPKLCQWEPEPDSSMSKIAVGSTALLLGLLIFLAGLIYNKKKSIERMVVPTTEVLYPEDAL